MKKVILFLTLVIFPVAGFSASASKMDLEHVEIKLNDKRALQQGAQLFVNYCLSCHSAEYMRYNRMAADLDIPEEVVVENMIFNGGKIGDLMTTTMPAEDAKEWFGVAPPDLSLIARVRGSQWLYNYLKTFYLDESSPSGWNNVVFENVAMPHALYELQGRQKAVFKTVTDSHGNETEVLDHFEKVSEGKMTEEEYDTAVLDLTTFLVYISEPAKLVRIRYGLYTLLFLAIFGFFAYLLKKEYWTDVH